MAVQQLQVVGCQREGHLFRLSGLQGDTLEPAELGVVGDDVAHLVAHVQLDYLVAAPFPSVGHIECDGIVSLGRLPQRSDLEAGVFKGGVAQAIAEGVQLSGHSGGSASVRTGLENGFQLTTAPLPLAIHFRIAQTFKNSVLFFLIVPTKRNRRTFLRKRPETILFYSLILRQKGKISMKQKQTDNSISEKFSKEGVTYSDDRLAIIDSISSLGRKEYRVRVEAFIALLCLKGKASICINGDIHTIQANDLFLCHPNIILENSTNSMDMEFRCICLSPEYIKQMTLISRSTWDARQYIERNPVIHLEPEEVAIFCQYYDLLRSKLTGTPYKHQREVTDALLQAFMYEFHDTLDRSGNTNPHLYSSAENLFFEFTELLASSFPKSRSVAWYADKLHITPKYLSAICKETSGHTASEIINQYVVKDVQMMLKRTDKTIKEVANILDFPNLSFFGKYVKRYLGSSPREYREKIYKQS